MAIYLNASGVLLAKVQNQFAVESKEGHQKLTDGLHYIVVMRQMCLQQPKTFSFCYRPFVEIEFKQQLAQALETN